MNMRPSGCKARAPTTVPPYFKARSCTDMFGFFFFLMNLLKSVEVATHPGRATSAVNQDDRLPLITSEASYFDLLVENMLGGARVSAGWRLVDGVIQQLFTLLTQFQKGGFTSPPWRRVSLRWSGSHMVPLTLTLLIYPENSQEPTKASAYTLFSAFRGLMARQRR